MEEDEPTTSTPTLVVHTAWEPLKIISEAITDDRLTMDTAADDDIAVFIWFIAVYFVLEAASLWVALGVKEAASYVSS